MACFSPTGTSRKVAQAIVKGIGAGEAIELDVTKTPLTTITTLTRDEVLVVAVPVYGNACAPIALQRLDNLRGTDTPAVCVVVYGNRDFGYAARELSDFLTQRGFRVVGAAAFVGEHSYSTPDLPIAEGRPHADDLQEAKNFGLMLRSKVPYDVPAIDAEKLKCPSDSLLGRLRFKAFVWRYQRAQKKHPVKVLPITDKARCTACGLCAKVCPVAAISTECPTETAGSCIKCSACVKACPQRARTLPTPFAPVLAKNFKKQKPNIIIY